MEGIEYLSKAWTGVYYSPPQHMGTGWKDILSNTWDEVVANVDLDTAIEQGLVLKITKNEYGQQVEYNWDAIKDLFKQSSNLTRAKYEALIQVYEIIVKNGNPKDLEKLLNYGYIETPMEEPDKSKYFPDQNSTMLNSYQYFRDKEKADSGYKIYSMSPVLAAVIIHYTKYVVNQDMLTDYYKGNLSENEKKAFENKMLGAGILLNINQYGNVKIELPVNGTSYQVITVKTLDGSGYKLIINPEKLSQITIEQYSFGNSIANLYKSIDSTKGFLESQKSSIEEIIANIIFSEADGMIQGSIKSSVEAASSAAGPVAAGTIKAINIIKTLYEGMEKNEELDNVINMLEISEYYSAFGIDAQMSVVDHKAHYQYLNLNEETLAINYGAYKEWRKENKMTNVSLRDILSDNNILYKYFDFCKNEKDEYIRGYTKNLGDSDATKVFSIDDKYVINGKDLIKKWEKESNK